jgi:hypothetical protein
VRTTPVILIILAILAGLLLLAVILFFAVRIKAVITYNSKDGMLFKVSILKYYVYGTGDKDNYPNIRVSDYKIGRINRKKKKLEKKKRKEATKPESENINDVIKTIRLILSTFFDRFAKFLTVRAVRLKIGVATGDAASTAILYGVVVQSVAYLLELIDNITHLKSLRYSDLNVYPDYTSESFTADIKIVLTLPVWCTLSLLFRTGIYSIDKDKDKEKK